MANTSFFLVPNSDGSQRAAFPAGNYAIVSAPTGLSAAVSGGTVSLAWTDTTVGQGTTLIERSTDGLEWLQIASKLPAIATHSDFNLVAGTYQYRARHLLNGNYSTYSAATSATVVAVVAPGGTGISNNVLTIVGAGFGSVANPQALVYDDFSSGTNDAVITGSTPIQRRVSPTFTWITDGYAPRFSNAVVRPGKIYSSLHRFAPSTSYLSALQVNHQLPNIGDQFFISFWLRLVNNGTSVTDNYKPIYIYGTSGTEPSMPWGAGNAPGDTSFRWSAQDGNWSGTNYQGITLQPFFDGWCRVDYRVVQSDAGAQNGSVGVFVHRPNSGAVQSWINSTVRTRGANTRWFDQVSLGEFSNTPAGSDLRAYMSDVYVSDTSQRVELADSATWSSRTFSEIQPGLTWADTQITCRFNKGAFSTGQTAYIFTVSSTNVATYTGQSITIPA